MRGMPQQIGCGVKFWELLPLQAEEDSGGWPIVRKASEISTVVQLIPTDPS